MDRMSPNLPVQIDSLYGSPVLLHVAHVSKRYQPRYRAEKRNIVENVRELPMTSSVRVLNTLGIKRRKKTTDATTDRAALSESGQKTIVSRRRNVLRYGL